MKDIFDYFILIHVISSTLFMIIALAVILRSLFGWLKELNYTRFDLIGGWLYMIFLYFELVMGIVMYFFIRRPVNIQSVEEAMRQSTLRFWGLLHFVIMLFVMILSQIGWIFILKSKLSKNKFKYSFIYFGGGILITLGVLTFYIIQKS